MPDEANLELIRFRESQGWTLEDAAARAGVSYKTISRAERGLSIGWRSKVKIADGYGRPIADFFEMERRAM